MGSPLCCPAVLHGTCNIFPGLPSGRKGNTQSLSCTHTYTHTSPPLSAAVFIRKVDAKMVGGLLPAISQSQVGLSLSGAFPERQSYGLWDNENAGALNECFQSDGSHQLNADYFSTYRFAFT